MFKSNHFNIIKEIALTDLKLRYKNSILGYFWSLGKPLLLFGVYYVIFTKVFNFGKTIDNYPIYLLLGIVMWQFFSEFSSVGMSCIVNKGGLIKKVFFPRHLLVISTSMTSFITFLLNLIVVMGYMFVYGIDPSWRILIFPLLLIELYIFTMGVVLILSSLYVKFRDLQHLWSVLLIALFYSTPILYSLDHVPGGVEKIVSLNPLAQIIQDARQLLLPSDVITVSDILPFPLVLIPYLIPVFLVIIGILLFGKMSAKFAEEI